MQRYPTKAYLPPLIALSRWQDRIEINPILHIPSLKISQGNFITRVLRLAEMNEQLHDFDVADFDAELFERGGLVEHLDVDFKHPGAPEVVGAAGVVQEAESAELGKIGEAGELVVAAGVEGAPEGGVEDSLAKD
jgi:hypothetical protein